MRPLSDLSEIEWKSKKRFKSSFYAERQVDSINLFEITVQPRKKWTRRKYVCYVYCVRERDSDSRKSDWKTSRRKAEKWSNLLDRVTDTKHYLRLFLLYIIIIIIITIIAIITCMYNHLFNLTKLELAREYIPLVCWVRGPYRKLRTKFFFPRFMVARYKGIA